MIRRATNSASRPRASPAESVHQSAGGLLLRISRLASGEGEAGQGALQDGDAGGIGVDHARRRQIVKRRSLIAHRAVDHDRVTEHEVGQQRAGPPRPPRCCVRPARWLPPGTPRLAGRRRPGAARPGAGFGTRFPRSGAGRVRRRVLYFRCVAAPGDRLDDLAEKAQHHVGGHVDRSDDLRWLDDSRRREIVFQEGDVSPGRRTRVCSHQ
jgi:hypothetical protein